MGQIQTAHWVSFIPPVTTYFNWKKKCEGLSPPERRRVKQLEEENTKLRKLVADCLWTVRGFRM